MRYINTKTQAVIETACVCAGGDWVLLDQPKEPTKPAPKKNTKKDVIKNGNIRND